MRKNYLLAYLLLVLLSLPTLADRATDKVTEHLNNREITLAITEATRLVKKHPSNFQYIYQLLALKHTQAEYDEVIDLCIKLDKLKPEKPEPNPTPDSMRRPYSHTGKLPPFLAGETRLEYIPNAPRFYQQVYYSVQTRTSVSDSLSSFKQLVLYDSIPHIPQPLTLQQAKNLCYQHLVIIHRDTITDLPQHQVWLSKLTSISVVEYLIEYYKLTRSGDDSENELLPNSVLLNTPAKKLSTYLLADLSLLDDKAVNEAIELTAEQYPVRNIRLRIFKSIEEGELDEVFELLENSRLSHEERATLLLEQSELLPEKKLLQSVLKYHQLIKNKQSKTRGNLEQEWIRLNTSSEVKDLLADIHFLIQEGNFSTVDDSQFSLKIYLDERDSLTKLLPSIPDSLYLYLSSKPIEGLKQLLPHINQFNSAALRVFLLFQIKERGEAIHLLDQELKITPNSIELRLLALSDIRHQHELQDVPTEILQHLEAIYVNELSPLIREVLDVFTVERLSEIHFDKEHRARFKLKLYLQKAYKRYLKAHSHKDLAAHSFYTMLGMDTEYQKTLEKIAKQRLALSNTEARRDPSNEFLKNLKANQAHALKTAANDINDILRSRTDYLYIAKSLYKEAEKKDLHLELTQLITPKNNDRIFRWIVFYNLMEYVGNEDAVDLALSVIRKHEFCPVQYRPDLAMILMPNTPNKALELLKSLPHDMQTHVNTKFIYSFRSSTLTGQRRLQAIKLFLNYIQYYDANRTHIFTGVTFTNIFSTICGHEELNTPPYIPSAQKIPPTEYSQERDVVINAIALELMHYSESENSIFELYIKKNNPADEEIMQLSALILMQQTEQLTDKYYRASIYSGDNYKSLKSPYDYAVHYLITEPEKAKAIYGNQLIHFLKHNNKYNHPHQAIPYILQVTKEQDPKKIAKIVSNYFNGLSSSELIFATHYNPLILPELTRQYFKHIDQYSEAVEKQVIELNGLKPSDLEMDINIRKSLDSAARVVSNYCSISKYGKIREATARRLINADPLSINPNTDFSTGFPANDIHHVLRYLTRQTSPDNSLFTLDLSKDYPGLFSRVKPKTNLENEEILEYLKELNLLVKVTDIDFQILSPVQQTAWKNYLSMPNRDKHNTRFATRSLFLHLAHVYQSPLGSQSLEKSIPPELATSFFCLKACSLIENVDELLDYLQINVTQCKQLSKQQQSEFFYVLGLDSSLSADLEKRPELMKQLGIPKDHQQKSKKTH